MQIINQVERTHTLGAQGSRDVMERRRLSTFVRHPLSYFHFFECLGRLHNNKEQR